MIEIAWTAEHTRAILMGFTLGNSLLAIAHGIAGERRKFVLAYVMASACLIGAEWPS